LPEADVRRLEEFGEAVRQRYSGNLITKEHIANSATDAAFDGDRDTFWSAPPGSHHAILEAHFRQPVKIDRTLIMEWLNDGQRVEQFRIEVWDGRNWKSVVAGHAIGHMRIDIFPAVSTSRIRLNILSSSAEGHIREFQVFDGSGVRITRTVSRSKEVIRNPSWGAAGINERAEAHMKQRVPSLH
jgi:alpha-L-fucosidase